MLSFYEFSQTAHNNALIKEWLESIASRGAELQLPKDLKPQADEKLFYRARSRGELLDNDPIKRYANTQKGGWRKGPKDITSDLQLRCYARAVQRIYRAKAEDIKAALYYLEGAELVGAKFTQQSLDAVEQELLETYMAIQSMKPEEAYGNVGDHCRRCDYNKICPFYSLT